MVAAQTSHLRGLRLSPSAYNVMIVLASEPQGALQLSVLATNNTCCNAQARPVPLTGSPHPSQRRAISQPPSVDISEVLLRPIDQKR